MFVKVEVAGASCKLSLITKWVKMLIGNIESAYGWRLAALSGEWVVDLNRACQLSLNARGLIRESVRQEAQRIMPSDLSAWLMLPKSERLANAKAAVNAGRALTETHGIDWAMTRQLSYPVSQALLAPPISPLANVLAIGLNYESHGDEAKMEMPKFPLVFSKPSPTIAGPNQAIGIPFASNRIDYEGELVAIIGQRCYKVPEADALSYVAGFTLANDISARDWQFRTSEMMLGKAFDNFCPMGPWMVTADEITDVQQLKLKTRVNGEVRQDASVSEMIFSIPKLVSYISEVMTLQPGDAILTGTPAGIGATRKPRTWLQQGDLVEVSVEGIGTLTTPII